MVRFRRILDRTIFSTVRPRAISPSSTGRRTTTGPALCAASTPSERAAHLEASRQFSLSLLYWLQTEAPRPDGGDGYPGLLLRGDVVGGAPDGLALAPYVGNRGECAPSSPCSSNTSPTRSVRTDPTIRRLGRNRLLSDRSASEGQWRPYLDIGAGPFRSARRNDSGARRKPPSRREEPGRTHITDGAFRVHPVEWTIGEVAEFWRPSARAALEPEVSSTSAWASRRVSVFAPPRGNRTRVALAHSRLTPRDFMTIQRD